MAAATPFIPVQTKVITVGATATQVTFTNLGSSQLTIRLLNDGTNKVSVRTDGSPATNTFPSPEWRVLPNSIEAFTVYPILGTLTVSAISSTGNPGNVLDVTIGEGV